MLSYSNMEKANAQNVDFSFAQLFHVFGGGVNLKEATLKETEIIHATLPDVDLSYAKLEGTSITTNSKLNDANFSYATLNGTKITDSELQRANFSYATLKRVCIQDSNINEINFYQTTLEKTCFDHSVWISHSREKPRK